MNFKKILLKRESILLLIIILVIITFSSLTKNFLVLNNLTGLFADVSIKTIIAIGMTVLLIGGDLDISVGTHFGFLGIILGWQLASGVNFIIAIIVTLLVGAFDGLVIGLLVAKLDINPFIATLGAMFVFWGLPNIITYASKAAISLSSSSFGNFPEIFKKIASTKIYHVELLNIYMIVILILSYIFLSKNVFFRQIFYVGGNKSTGKLSGIKTNIITIFNFTFISILVAVAAILKASRIGNTSATSAYPMASLSIIAAVVLGGGNLKGGYGSIIGTFLGVILLATIENGINAAAIDPFYSNIIIGLILLFAVVSDEIIRKLAKKSNNY
ncbi:MAG: ABC transporter permease [Actinobacteria bacterium]|nr:ABC transporter permease [Actinomycetota bacterium]